LENGVGLTRDFIRHFRKELPALKRRSPKYRLSLVSGVLGSRALENYVLPELRKLPDLELRMHTVINHFWGEGITIAGLLVGEDIYSTLVEEELGDVVVLPPRVLNHDGLFLDDWTPEQLEEKLGRPIVVFPDSFTELFDLLETGQTRKKARPLKGGFPGQYVTEQMKGGADY
jgi:NifB/MoaA-like Fe-S oxidoreductase